MMDGIVWAFMMQEKDIPGGGTEKGLGMDGQTVHLFSVARKLPNWGWDDFLSETGLLKLIFIGSINHKPGAEDTEMNKTNPCYDGT